MHYINGREAREGDFVIYRPSAGKGVKAGSIHSLRPGTETCNAQVSFAVPGGFQQWSVTVGTECLHAEDAWAAFDQPVDERSV